MAMDQTIAEAYAVKEAEMAEMNEGQVLVAIGCVEEAQRDIGRLLTDLGGRLHPVLREQYPRNDTPGESEPESICSPVAQRLYELNAAQHGAMAVIRDYMERLEV